MSQLQGLDKRHMEPVYLFLDWGLQLRVSRRKSLESHVCFVSPPSDPIACSTTAAAGAHIHHENSELRLINPAPIGQTCPRYAPLHPRQPRPHRHCPPPREVPTGAPKAAPGRPSTCPSPETKGCPYDSSPTPRGLRCQRQSRR